LAGAALFGAGLAGAAAFGAGLADLLGGVCAEAACAKPKTGKAAARMTIVRCKDITGTRSFNIVTGRWLAVAWGCAIDPKPLVGKLTPAAALCRSRR
jgi:hypothetical protein